MKLRARNTLVIIGALGLLTGVWANSLAATQKVDVSPDSILAPASVTAPAPTASAKSVPSDCLSEVSTTESGVGSTNQVYAATFTGTPTAPLALCPKEGFDVQIHSRDPSTWTSLEAMEANHGSHCAGPPAVHSMNGDYRSAVFQCKDHVMTAIRASGYGVIYLTPARMVDLHDRGTVSFDMSTHRSSTRDWVDVWITPYNDNIALPFDDGDVDLQGIPRNGIHISNGNSQGNWTVDTISNFVPTKLYESYDGIAIDKDISSTVDQSATRQTFRVSLSRTHIQLVRLASDSGPAITYVDKDVADVGFDRGVVQFGHHSYNPTKDNAGTPATWHWDNLTIFPAVPFDIINADRRFAEGPEQIVKFFKVAPANGHLRFSGIGTVEVSFDGGPWKPAVKAAASKSTDGYHPEHLSSYWTPVPAATSSVRFRFSPEQWYRGPYIAKDISVWASVPDS